MDIKFIILGLALVMYLLVIIFQEKKVWMTSCAALAVIVLGFLAQGGALAGNVFCMKPGVKGELSYRAAL